MMELHLVHWAWVETNAIYDNYAYNSMDEDEVITSEKNNKK